MKQGDTILSDLKQDVLERDKTTAEILENAIQSARLDEFVNNVHTLREAIIDYLISEVSPSKVKMFKELNLYEEVVKAFCSRYASIMVFILMRGDKL